VTFHPGKSAKRENPELIEILCHSIAGVASEAKQASIALCLENMGAERPGFPIFSPEEHLRICDQAGIEICLDVPHLASVYPQFADTESAIRLMAPHIRHVHLGDTELPHHKHLPIGMGDLRVGEVLEVLQNCAYDGHAIVEEFNRGWAPEEYWRRAVQFRDSFVHRALHGV
jgi:sugar phosphate isomerase/epimerase